jgi:ferredoxin
MLGLARSAHPPHKGYASCNGCGLCLLVCPVWRRYHDIALTPLGRAKALQHGAALAEIAESLQGCAVCGACEPVCPEDIGLVALTLDLRRRLVPPGAAQSLRERMDEQAARPLAPQTSAAATMLLPDQALRARPATLARAAALLGGESKLALAPDDGADIALALEAGVAIAAPRLERFLRALRGSKRIVVADGLLLRQLRLWLPQTRLESLGVALSSLPGVRRALRAGDLYVIEVRAYHADYQRLVRYYDGLRSNTGCTLNLDLQRIAIPATARSLAQRLGLEAIDDGVQLRWILQGRNVARIVVESMEDGSAFAQVGGCPVVHLADLVDDGTSYK